MSQHSYTKVWLHIIWCTLRREKSLIRKEVREEVSLYLYRYAKEKSIFLKKNYVNSDHVHMLLDLPTNLTIENMLQLMKGSSSHWINQNQFVRGKFAWARGYSVFSVSHSSVARVEQYIVNQQEHHHQKTFMEEYQRLISSHDLIYKRVD